MTIKRAWTLGVFAAVLLGVQPGALASGGIAGEDGAIAGKTVACALRTSPMSPGEIAFARHELPKAETMFREESNGTGVNAERAHNALIRALLSDDKIDEAEKDADPWFAGSPKNIWAAVSSFEVLWRRGEVLEALERIYGAEQLDACNPRLHADYAKMLAFSGLYAAAKKQADLAHRLDPVDDDIATDWVGYQPRAEKLAFLTDYLSRSDFLTADARKSLEEWKKRLSDPAEPPCTLKGAVKSMKIPFERMQNGANAAIYWGLEVSFNGKGRALEIDTGAHGLMLTRSAARALHLPIETKEKIGGFGDEGAIASHTSLVKSVKIGPLEFENCQIEILDENPEGMEGNDGLIGGDVFSDFVLTLDFPGRVMKLDPLPPLPGSAGKTSSVSLKTGAKDEDETPHDRYVDPSMKNWTQVFRDGHDLILPVRLNNGPYRLFIMDTGAGANLISWKLAKQFATVRGSEARIEGLSGEIKRTYTTGPLTLSFAGRQQKTVGMMGIDMSSLGKSMGVEIGGFIGAYTLHQATVQIDYRDNLVRFDLDPKRLTRCADTLEYQVDCYVPQ